jgi:hypothetical protein
MAADGVAPALDNPHGLALPAGCEAILAEMFAGYNRLTVAEELAGGFSGSRVFVVRPLRADGLPELPAVVKIGPPSLVEREWRAYQEHVQNRLPGVAAIQGAPRLAPGASCAGLRYPLVGSGTFAVETLQQFYTHADGEQLRYVLEQRLFRQLGALWRFNYPQANFSLRDSYDYLLPVNLVIRPEPLPAGAAAHSLDGSSRAHPPWTAGDFVRLEGFAASKAEASQGEITLNLLEPQRSFRIRLRDVAAPQQFAAGASVDGLTGRILSTRREILGVIALEIWGYTFDASADTLALPGGRLLPNPLARLPAVLAATPTVRIAAIHGDLNPQNILVDPETREVRLIDFADARRDHVLHDLLRLETGIVTRLLPYSLAGAGLPPEVIVALYEQLAGEPRAAAASVSPPLARAAAMLAAVREAARSYLFDPDDWTEYWHGLTLYLIGAHKYANLDVTAKKVAFLGAAASQHLVAEHALRAPSGDVLSPAVPPPRPFPEEMPPLRGPVAPPLPAPATGLWAQLPWWLPALVVLAALIVAAAVWWPAGNGQPSPTPAASTPAGAGAAATQAPAEPSATAPPTAMPTAPPARPAALPATMADCQLRGAGRSIAVLLDISQSMHGARLQAATAALQQFISCLDPQATIAVYPFNDAVYPLEPPAPAAETSAALQKRLNLLFASGNSALYDAVCSIMAPLASDGEGRGTTVIVLADGPDTASATVTSEAELLACIPGRVELHTIAYGPEADAELLARLAEQGNGVALRAEPATIGQILRTIPLEP